MSETDEIPPVKWVTMDELRKKMPSPDFMDGDGLVSYPDDVPPFTA